LDDRKPRKKEEYMYMDCGEGYTFPDPSTFPDTCYLVVGSNPGENPKDRTFYTDEHYYLLGDHIDDHTPNPDHSRFICADFNQDLTEFSSRYNQTFDAVIFDWSTTKFITNPDTITVFLSVLKQTGQLIIENIPSIFRVAVPNGPRREMILAGRNATIALQNRIIEIISLSTYPFLIRTYREVIPMFPIADRVYGPLPHYIENHPDEGEYHDDINCIIVYKPSLDNTISPEMFRIFQRYRKDPRYPFRLDYEREERNKSVAHLRNLDRSERNVNPVLANYYKAFANWEETRLIDGLNNNGNQTKKRTKNSKYNEYGKQESAKGRKTRKQRRLRKTSYL